MIAFSYLLTAAGAGWLGYVVGKRKAEYLNRYRGGIRS